MFQEPQKFTLFPHFATIISQLIWIFNNALSSRGASIIKVRSLSSIHDAVLMEDALPGFYFVVTSKNHEIERLFVTTSPDIIP